MSDPVNRPAHYTSRKIECIEVTEQFNFCLGNAIKYIWRAGSKDPAKEAEDLEKAIWYIRRHIQSIKPPLEVTDEENQAWDEKRADVIGQNGNDGEHYNTLGNDT